MHAALRGALLVTILAAAALGCSEEPRLVVAACQTDADCGAGELCDDGQCVPQSKFRCDATASGAGLLQPTPHALDFGLVSADVTSMTLKLRNIGNCALTVFDATLDGGKDSPFTCDECLDANFPIEIFPMREKTLTLRFTAPDVGTFTDKLTLLSDDSEFPSLPVPLSARFDGVPKLQADPATVKFGYVAQGQSKTAAVQLTNHGTGVASVQIVGVTIDPPTSLAFALEGSTANPLPTSKSPVSLDPISIDPRDNYVFTVRYTPRAVGDDNADVVVQTSSAQLGTLRIPLAGTSKTPPSLSVNPEAVDFGNVAMGAMTAKTLTFVNSGGSPLTLSWSFKNSCPPTNPKCSPDFSFDPPVIPTIEPGSFFEMQVFVTPSATGAISGLLQIQSNDPHKPAVTVPLSANGTNGAGTQVVKVEVSYENGANTSFDDDLRRLELSLESPYGFLCNKAEPKPTTWGDFGSPTWTSLGIKLNPQRVLLVNPKQDGKYRVLLQYTEDCSTLPTQMLASILGVSIDALIAYFTTGTVNLDSSAVSGAISSACLNHAATKANVTVWVNGTTLAEKSVTLVKKGDFTYALDIVRANGQFTAH